MSIQSNFPNLKPSLLLDFANTKQLDNRVTFTRSTPAVYYDGRTTAMAEQNLSSYSTTFGGGSFGMLNNSSKATGYTAPDGTSTAYGITIPTTATNFGTRDNTGWSAGTYTLSVYAKAGTTNFLEMDMQDSYYAFFTLTGSGTVSNTSGITSSSITSVGNGWYRCSITATVSTFGFFDLQPSQSASSVFWDGTQSSSIAAYLWGPQLENRSTLTAYTPTTTQPITNYIPVLLTAGGNQPRFDCNPTTGESLGLLIEESRTNLLLYSSQFDDAAWTKGGASVTANANVSPDGTLNADKIVEDTSTGDHRIYQQTSFTSGTAYTFTVYAKASGRTLVQLFNGMSGGFSSTFDLSAGTITNTAVGTATITNVGNGWYRCSVSNTSGLTGNSNNQIRLVSTGTTTSYTGDGFSGIFVWGAQLELGAFATSYIPTVASTVTRAADAASMTGTNFSSWFNNSEGTVFITYRKNVGTSGRLTVFESTSLTVTTNGINIDLISATSARTEGFANGTNYWYYNLTVVQQAVQNLALGYKTNDIGFSANGGSPSVDTSAVMASTGITALAIGSRIDGAASLNGYLNKIAYYPIKVTSSQLQSLTS